MASLFWAYAHDRLRWLWIFRPGPLSALVRGIAGYLDDIREDVIWTRNQYLASLAIKDLMPGYAQSRAVPRTRYDSDEQHRTRVVRAYAWHHLGGKVTACRRFWPSTAIRIPLSTTAGKTTRNDGRISSCTCSPPRTSGIRRKSTR